MSTVRNILLWVLFGAGAGTWAGGFFAQSFVPWFNTPGTGIQAQCACADLARSVVGHMLTFELWGMLAGAVAFLVLGLVLGAGRKRKVEPPAPATPPPAAA